MIQKLLQPTIDEAGNPGSTRSGVTAETPDGRWLESHGWHAHGPEFMPGDPTGEAWTAEQRAIAEAAAFDAEVEARERQLRIAEVAKERRKAQAAAERADAYRVGGVDLDDFLGEEEPPPDWVIPGILERQDRIIVTGLEGSGKTVLSRQVAMCAASGVHPFDLTMAGIKPVRVLVVDLENPTALVRRGYRALKGVAGPRYTSGNLTIVSKPEGMDLVGNDGAELRKEIEAAGEIDLLVIGPLYKMVATGDISEEPVARDLTMTLDRIRIEHGFALWIEAHAPHQQPGGDISKMIMRPYGASLFKRWPEFGYFIHWNPLTGVGEFIKWRQDRQPDRVWPSLLKRGGTWPWTSPTSEEDLAWQPIKDAAEKFAMDNKGKTPSIRKLAAEVGMSSSSVDRFLRLESVAIRWDLLKASALERWGPPPRVHEGQGIITQGDEKVSQVDRE